MDLDKEIERLVGEWCCLIAHDHHKDRDCHFRIVKKFSYGEPANYYFEHNGYIFDDIYSESFDSYAKAAKYAIAKIQSMIDSYGSN